MLKMMEKKSNDKGELINQTAWFTRLAWTIIPSATSQMCKVGAQLDVANVSALKISICVTW